MCVGGKGRHGQHGCTYVQETEPGMIVEGERGDGGDGVATKVSIRTPMMLNQNTLQQLLIDPDVSGVMEWRCHREVMRPCRSDVWWCLVVSYKHSRLCRYENDVAVMAVMPLL